jgi:hypothetical protein
MSKPRWDRCGYPQMREERVSPPSDTAGPAATALQIGAGEGRARSACCLVEGRRSEGCWRAPSAPYGLDEKNRVA